MYDVRNMLRAMIDLCIVQKWEFMEILNETWADVSKRDWRKYPGRGLPEEAAA